MVVSVDGMTEYASKIMPPPAPLDMVQQSFGAAPVPRVTHSVATVADMIWRIAAFVPAGLLTLSLLAGLSDWMSTGGVTILETAIITLVGLTFIWISLPVTTAVLGLIRRVIKPRRARINRRSGQDLRVALLVPVYNEPTAEVFGNIRAIMRELAQRSDRDRYTAFILSDTNDPRVAIQEEQAVADLRAGNGASRNLFYRRRAANVDKKVGNITDWIVNWGGNHDAMLILDSDSLMSGAAIRNLVRALQNDPDAGLVQSFPVVIGAETLFGRVQQFSNAVYGWLLAEGLAVWSQREGNYWGHNAIIRIQAFAQSAQLPRLIGRRGESELILSHDFVEAGMLRRAGWGVRFQPRAEGSFEETPQTLIDYALRDRRWCQGNLQHLRILNARGFHPISRFHMLQGAVAFLLSPAWLMLIAIWSISGLIGADTSSYFSAANPLHPIWPEMARFDGEVFLLLIYLMLLLPKLLSIAAMGANRRTRRSYGGLHRFLATALFEMLCSVLYAPILMVQQTIAVGHAVMGRRNQWLPQSRNIAQYGWGQLCRFHAAETVIGVLMAVGIFYGILSVWLLPVAFSLTLAIPMSWLSAVRVNKLPIAAFRLETPQTLREPKIIAMARAERANMRHHLAALSIVTPAE